MRRIFWIVCVLTCAGCGGTELPEVMGTYDGTAELYNATNFGMVTNEDETVISVTPLEDDPLTAVIGIDRRCSLTASIDQETTVQVAEQTCEWETPITIESWQYAGEGLVSGATLTLELSGEFTRTYTDNSGRDPLTGNHSLTFQGQRL